ncbi:PAS domain S-box protein [Leptolyngbya sp. NK1-12]|uniref:histidine kinase n=1 Tax=Leptolyngbya sp. NK1-12 TaxID=2547451 RepID=A0AA96WK14_9CYAN|nr:PAS domain S-box protein [Leptolyngbya sp. NK1-12]
MQRPQPETIILEDILITEELFRRSPRPSNWQAQAEAMQRLAQQMARDSESLMPTLVNTALELCQAGTAGVSLLETAPNREESFRWDVLAGTLAHRVGSTISRNFSSCGVCLDQGTAVLFSHPERYFTHFQDANTPLSAERNSVGIVEELVLPLIADSHVFGTIWIMSHHEGQHFDSEDARLMTSLADFAATALLLKQRQTGELLAANAALETEIAERKHVEGRTHALISSLPGGAVFVVNRDLRYLLAEGEALSVAGFKPEDFVGRTIFEVLPSELAANYEPMYCQALAGKPFEHEHHAHDHTYVSRGIPLQTETGEIDAVLAVSYDITERKQAEAALRESEAKYRSLFNSIDAGFCIFEMLYNEAGEAVDFCYIETNPAFEQQSGRRPQPGQTMRELFPEAEDMWLKDYAEVARTGQPKRFIDYHENLDRWFDVFVFPTSNGKNQLAALFSDVTDEKRAEAALRESEERLQKAMSIETVGVLFFTLDGRITDANDTFLRLSGYSRDELCNLTNWQELTPPEFWDATSVAAQDLATLGNTVPYEKQHIRKDGSRWWGLFAPTRLKGSGHHAKCVEFVIDISEAKRVEDERKLAEAQLRRAAEMDVFRIKLADALRSLSDPEEIKYQAACVLGKHLGSDRAYYVEIDEARSEFVVARDWHQPGAPSHARRYPLSGWPMPWLVDGQPWVVRDVDTDSAMPDDQRASYRGNDIGALIVVPLIKNGRLVATLATNQHTPRNWTTEEITAVQETAERTWAAVERAYAEAALRESEQKYRTLFDSIDEGLAIVEMIYDDQGEIVDIIFRQVNRAYERHGGVYDVVGRSIFDVIPGVEDYWLDLYNRVARTGEPVREENYQQDVDRWFDVYFSRIDDNGRFVAIVFSDISDRKQRERQQEYLLKLSDALRPLVAAEEIETTACRVLGEWLGAHRVYYVEIFESEGVGRVSKQYLGDGAASIAGDYPIAAFDWTAQALRRGEAVVVSDVYHSDLVPPESIAAMEAVQQISIVLVPLIKEGKWVGVLTVGKDAPRDWREEDVELVRETLERMWAAAQRARTEVALRESEAKYRSLFESINDGFALLEVLYDDDARPVDCRFLEVSPSFEVHTTLPQAQGKTLRELIPSVESGWFEHYHQALVTNAPVHFEMYQSHIKIWLEVDVFPYGNPQVRAASPQENRQVVIVFRNINDRKHAEAQLRRAADMDAFRVKLSDALRSLTDPVQIQAEACRLLGEQLGVDRAYYVEIYEAEGYARVNQHYSRGDSPSIVGDYRLSEYGWSMQLMRRGETIVITDTQSSPVVPDHERAAMAMLQMVGFVALPLIKGEVLVGALTLNEPTPREWTEAEVELVRETAERIWADIQRAQAETALRESELQRIQEQSAREQERQRAETLAELDRAKTLFFSNVSHEFRTPLTLSLAPLQDALSDRTHPLDPVHRERLELVHRNSLHLLKLVNTLLDFSRIEAGRIEAVYEPTDLAQFTMDLASVFRSAIERAGLRLVVDCSPLPESVYVDREMWEKIVLNLLSNAFKFTFAGEIAVRLYGADNQVMLQIQDTGTGIAPEHLPHLFKRFYQIRGTQARTHEGSGIGLALVHELIRLQGGTIEVSSTLGQGTCFTIALPFGTDHLPPECIQVARPLTSPALAADPYIEAAQWLPEDSNPLQPFTKEKTSAKVPAKVPLSKGDLGGSPELPTNATASARVLIVDDNADMREYLTRILSDQMQVEAVADGAAALAAIQARVPNLVLTDVMMPRLDGFQLLQALRAAPRTREIPIILLSARAGEEAIVEGLAAGADDYLIKPFSAQELVSRVHAHVHMAHLCSETLHQERTSSRRKDEFLSIVSHELNTPLVAILGWTRLLRANPSNSPMAMKALDTIERNAMVQANLVQDLLHLSRITAGKLRLNLQLVELESVIETAIATVHHLAEAKVIDLVWNRTGQAPPENPVVVMGDHDRLQQVICNLLNNAIKFTPGFGRITVELKLEGRDAQIRVSDTGIGISPEFLPHVFDRFQQARDTDSAKGLGLGLAIARHLVELHNGTIQAESAGAGQGATFMIRLPIRDAEVGESEPAEAAEAAEA